MSNSSSEFGASFRLFGDLLKGLDGGNSSVEARSKAKAEGEDGGGREGVESKEEGSSPPPPELLQLLPTWDTASDAHLISLDNLRLLRRLLDLQRSRSQLYSLYHRAFRDLVQAAEEVAAEQASQQQDHFRRTRQDNRAPLPEKAPRHSCAAENGLVIDPKRIQPSFQVFAEVSGRIAEAFQAVSQDIIQVEDVLKQRAQDDTLEPRLRSQAKVFAGQIRSLQRLEQRKLETTVQQQAITTRHRVIQNDPFSEEYTRLSLGLRQALGEIVQDINDLLSEIRSEVYQQESD